MQIGLGWGVFAGMAGDNRPHSHHAFQVLLSEAPKALWTEPAGWGRYRGVMIGPELRHELAPGTERVTLIYVEPDSELGRRLQRSLRDGIRILSDEETRKIRHGLDQDPMRTPDQLLADVLDSRAELQPLAAADEVIDRIIATLPTRLVQALSAATLAREAGLSSSRFQHRFRTRTGLPLRPYLRWRRLLVAMSAVMRGQALTDAALAGGFADAAHFTRTVSRHFGITPRSLLRLNSLFPAQSVRSRRSDG